MLDSAVGELSVDLVRQDKDICAPQHLGDGLQIFPAHDTAGWVVGVWEDEQFALRGNGCF